MRIISGTHKGRRLKAPSTLPVRPTTDRAKEALFNILENRYYEYDDIRNFFPFLQVVKPNDITKFLWGIEPKYSEQDFTVIKENSGTLSISFENQPREETLKGLTKAVFKDSANNQKVTIRLSSRTHNETPFDLTKAWSLMHS